MYMNYKRKHIKITRSPKYFYVYRGLVIQIHDSTQHAAVTRITVYNGGDNCMYGIILMLHFQTRADSVDKVKITKNIVKGNT